MNMQRMLMALCRLLKVRQLKTDYRVMQKEGLDNLNLLELKMPVWELDCSIIVLPL